MHSSKIKTSISDASHDAKCWRHADVIDFEFLLERDRHRSIGELEQRDQRILHEHIAPKAVEGGSETDSNRRSLLRGWLEARRSFFAEERILPGEPSIEAWRFLLKVIALIGLTLGTGAAANLLSYDGQQPVNVAAFLGWLVLLQIILALMAGVVLVLRKTHFLSAETSMLGSLVNTFWSWLVIRINRHALSRVPADQRTQFEAFVGSTAQHRSIYGEVALWPIVGSIQIFGICFNMGALLTTIALVVFSDRAFGWQSAVSFSPEQIHQLTQTLAVPWSWAVENAAPTLEQIEGSKIVLKDGIKQLTTGDLVSWWPFLCLSLGVYGLFPRIILWIATVVFGNRALQQLPFDQVACDRLCERLRNSKLETAGQGNESSRTAPPTHQTSGEQNRTNDSATDRSAIALIGTELFSQIDHDQFAELTRNRFHLNIEQTMEWSDQTATIENAITKLRNVRQSAEQLKLVLLEEAWQPPIAEKLGGLRTLRDSLGAHTKIIVALVGRPEGANALTPVKPSDKLVWERQIQSLGDTHLRLEQLIDHE